MNIISSTGMDSLVSGIFSGYARLQGAQAGVIVMLVIGLICCFAGYRLTRPVSAVVGALIGGVLCTYVASSYLPSSISGAGSMVAGIVGALLVAYLFFHLYRVMIFVVCAGVGALLGSVPAVAMGADGGTSTVFYVIIAACALLFGLAGLLFLKPVLIVLTGLGGFLAAPEILVLAGMGTDSKISLLLGAALSLVGIIVQFATNRGRNEPGFKKKKDAAGFGADAASGAADTVGGAASAAVPKKKKKKRAAPKIKNPLLRLLVALSPILMIIAVLLTVVCQTQHYELVMVIALLCWRGRKYPWMLFGYGIMLLYNGYLTYAQWNITELQATGFNAAGCVVFAGLTLYALVCLLRPVPDTEEIGGAAQAVSEDATELLPADDELDATRPLTAEEAAEHEGMMDAAGDVSDADVTEAVSEDDLTEAVPDDDMTVAVPEDDMTGAVQSHVVQAVPPDEFRETLDEIFDAPKDMEIPDDDDDMAAEPDDLSTTRRF